MAHDVAILKGAGFAFIGIHAEIFGLINPGDKAPFDSRGKASSAPAPQTGFLYLLDYLLGSQPQSFADSLIASIFKVDINLMQMRKIKLSAQNLLVHSPIPK
jgi:hypothetical protein